MSNERSPDFSLFVDILQTLERIQAPYMIIGAFAATLYGITRVTYDIDIVVSLTEPHIQALVETYPPPRYYADPEQIRDSVAKGIMFNIIDSSRGEKADLVPLTMASNYSRAFQHRIRQFVDMPGTTPFEVWCARPEDVIIGKLMAWAEGQGRRHETDIFEMMVFHYLEVEIDEAIVFDEASIDVEAVKLGRPVAELWQSIKQQARTEADQNKL